MIKNTVPKTQKHTMFYAVAALSPDLALHAKAKSGKLHYALKSHFKTIDIPIVKHTAANEVILINHLILAFCASFSRQNCPQDWEKRAIRMYNRFRVGRKRKCASKS